MMSRIRRASDSISLSDVTVSPSYESACSKRSWVSASTAVSGFDKSCRSLRTRCSNSSVTLPPIGTDPAGGVREDHKHTSTDPLLFPHRKSQLSPALLQEIPRQKAVWPATCCPATDARRFAPGRGHPRTEAAANHEQWVLTDRSGRTEPGILACAMGPAGLRKYIRIWDLRNQGDRGPGQK